jgi:hypothetical protein
VLLGDVPDQLLDEDGLPDAGAAEEADLAALGVRSEQVDDLDPGLEDLLGRCQVLDRRSGTVNGPPLLGLDLAGVVDRVAEEVEDAPERPVADGNGDRTSRVDDLVAALEAVGGVHRHCPHAVVAEVLLDLADEGGRVTIAVAATRVELDLERRVNLRKVVVEDGVDDDAGHRLHPARVGSVSVSVFVSHLSP